MKNFSVLIIIILLIYFSTPVNQIFGEETKDKKIEAYKTYIQKHPNDLNATIKLINLLFRQKRYNEVVSLYDDLDEVLKQKKEIIAMLCRAYFLLGKKDDVVKSSKLIVIYEDGSQASYRYAGTLLLSMGMLTYAEKILKEGRKKWGDKQFARELYLCYTKENDYKKALREILFYYENNHHTEFWVKKEIEGMIKADSSLIKELEAITKTNNIYEKLTGEILLTFGDLKKAKKYLLKTSTPSSLINYASACIDHGFYNEAEDALREVINNKGNKKEKALYLLSIVYERRGKSDKAIKSLNSLIKMKGTLEDSAIIKKAKILVFDKKEYEEGANLIEPLLKKTRKASPLCDKLLEITITAYIKLGNLKKAMGVLSGHNTANSLYFTAVILFLEGNYQKSKDTFLQAVSKAPDRKYANDALEKVMLINDFIDNPSFLNSIKKIEKLFWQEKYTDVLALINKSFEKFNGVEEKTFLLFLKGKAYTGNGSINEAIASYLSIPEENKSDILSPKALFLAGLLAKNRLKNLAMAKTLLEKVIFNYPDSPEAELSRGELESLKK